MALSNWDCCAWDSDGNPCKGEAKLGDLEFEIYKSEVRISVSGVLISSHWDDAHFFINDVEVYFKHHEDPEGVFVYAERHVCQKDADTIIERFFGIGIYGYDNNGEFVGVTPQQEADFNYWYLEDVRPMWSMNKKIELKPAKRYNLGDAYFAHKLGGEIRDVCSNVGEQKPTVMSQILESWTDPQNGQNKVSKN